MQKPVLVWSTAYEDHPDVAMDVAWKKLIEKAEAVPEVQKNFPNRLRLISRNDVKTSSSWTVTLTGEISPNR